MASVGLIIPIMPELIVSLSGLSIGQSAEIAGYMFFAYASMLFLGAPLLGNISDRFGRRPVIVLALFGLAIDYLIMANAQTIYLLFVGRMLSGILGATIPVVYASISDITQRGDRAKLFGLVGAFSGLGFILGPAIGGMISTYGERLPFWISAVICLCLSILVYFRLPETLPKEKRRQFRLLRANPLGSLIVLRGKSRVVAILAARLVFEIAFHSIAALWPFFTLAQFSWSKTEIGLSIAFYGVMVALYQSFAVGPIVSKLGERKTVVLGILAAVSGYTLLSAVDVQWLVYVAIIITAASSIAIPAMQSLLSSKVADTDQGELQGAVMSVVSLAAIFGPLIMSQIFSYSSAEPLKWPGMVYLVASALCCVSLAIFAGSLTPKTARQ